MLVIADGEKPVAVGGIMGGGPTEVSDTTRNVLLETADRTTRVGEASVVHLATIRSIMRTLAEEAGLRDPEAFSHSWHILMKGSIVAAGEGDVDAALRAKAMARLLLAEYRAG